MTVNGISHEPLLKRNRIKGHKISTVEVSIVSPIQPTTYEEERTKWEYYPEEGYLPLPTCSDLTSFRQCFRKVKLNPALIKILEELSIPFYIKPKGDKTPWWDRKVGCYYSTLATKLWCHPRTITNQLKKIIGVKEVCPICGEDYILLELFERRSHSPTNPQGNKWDLFVPGYIHYVAHLRKHKSHLGNKNFEDIIKTIKC